MIVVAQWRTIAHESAGNDKLSLEIDRRHRVLGRQPHDLFTHLTKKWCRRHKKGISVLLHAACENGFNVVSTAGAHNSCVPSRSPGRLFNQSSLQHRTRTVRVYEHHHERELWHYLVQ